MDRDICYYYNNNDKEWKKVVKRLRTARYDSSSIVVDNGQTLWVTGGRDYGDKVFKSTELISPESNPNPKQELVSFRIRKGPDLPLNLHSHCLVKLSSTTAMLIGGNNGPNNIKPTRITHFIDIPSTKKNQENLREPVSGPNMKTDRLEHICGAMKEAEGRLVVVVAGGSNEDGIVISTEILVDSGKGNNKLRIGDRWDFGPDLPESIGKAAAVTSPPDGKSLLVVGKRSGSLDSFIFRLEQKRNNWRWTRLSQKLQMGRSSMVAILVPDSFCRSGNV